MDLDSPLSLLLLNKYASVVFHLEGGGDWVTESRASGEWWTCPEGVYEVYAHLTAGAYLVDGDNRKVAGENLSTVEGWYPAVVAGGIDSLDVWWLGYVSMFPRGWFFTEGEKIKQNTGAWVVRYRRVG